jgi:TRAP-type C4-dicarboxylate transport system permease small subunit
VLEVAGPTLIWAGGAIVASVVGGWLISTMPSSSWVIMVSHKKVTLPGWSEGLVAGPLAIAAALMFVHAARSFRKSEPASAPSTVVDLA